MLYDRPLKQIIAEEALNELPEPFTTQDMIAWVREHYPLFKENTVRLHVVGLTANDPNKRHRGSSRSPWRDTIFKLDSNLYRKYNAATDPPPLPLEDQDGEDDDTGQADDGEDFVVTSESKSVRVRGPSYAKLMAIARQLERRSGNRVSLTDAIDEVIKSFKLASND